MAEEYVIVPRGAKNMTHEDIIFLPDTDIHTVQELLPPVRPVLGDQEVERGPKPPVLMDTFTQWWRYN